MNVHQFLSGRDCQSEGFENSREHKMAMALQAVSSSMQNLVDLSLVSENRECMANEGDFKTVVHIMTHAQFLASMVEVRMIANGEIEVEDAS